MEIRYLAYFCLMMTFGSLWIHRSAWLWGSFLALSFSLAIFGGAAQPFSLLVLALLFVLFWILKNPITGSKRHFLTLTAILLAAGLNYHWIPGFCNWQITNNFYLNFDKPLIGLFPLIFLVTVCQTREDWIKVGLKAVPLILLFIFGLAALALGTGVIQWQIKLPCHFLLRIISNMFLVVIPEEAFFRGFLQRELSTQIGRGILGKTVGIVGASIVFTLFHLAWTASPAMLALVFVAGIIYGLIYELSGFLEGSIICHFAVNLLHMLFFTYHAE
jgi:membrane protease YdiL (CAAX protease family)